MCCVIFTKLCSKINITGWHMTISSISAGFKSTITGIVRVCACVINHQKQRGLCHGPPVHIHMWRMGTEFLVFPVLKQSKCRAADKFQGDDFWWDELRGRGRGRPRGWEIFSHVKLMVLFKLSTKQTLHTEQSYMYILCPIQAWTLYI